MVVVLSLMVVRVRLERKGAREREARAVGTAENQCSHLS